MPQIDVSAFASQIFWLILVFIAIYFILQRFYLPKIHGIVLKRKSDLNTYIAESENLGKQLKELEAILMHEDALMRRQVSDTKSSARKSAESLFEEISTKNRADIAALQLRQEGELKEAIELLDSEVASIASEVSEEIALYLKKMYNHKLKI